MEAADFRAPHRDTSYQWADRRLKRELQKALSMCVNECMCESAAVRPTRRFRTPSCTRSPPSVDPCPGPDQGDCVALALGREK